MTQNRVRRYVEDLLRDRRPASFRPDDFESAQIRTAIDLHAAQPGADAPRPEFLADLHRTLAGELGGKAEPDPPPRGRSATRRQVIVGTSAAATAAVAAVSVDRMLIDNDQAHTDEASSEQQELRPNSGTWQRVAVSSDVAEGGVHAFDLGSVVGFVRRVDGRAQAVSGVCTHQGCRLWLDAADARLRCPCHSTSFTLGGQLVTHQLPIAPKPLPELQVREVNGVIEVFAPGTPL